jgi:hypothetical protein
VGKTHFFVSDKEKRAEEREVLIKAVTELRSEDKRGQ